MSIHYVCNRCHDTDLGPTGAGMSCLKCANHRSEAWLAAPTLTTQEEWARIFDELKRPVNLPLADAFWDIPPQEDYFNCTCCAKTLNRKAGKTIYRSTWESCYFCQADYCGSCTDDTNLAYCKKCRFPFCKISSDHLESCAEFNLNSLGYCKDCYKTKAIRGTHCF